MIIRDILRALPIQLVCGDETREVDSVYCCDLLSWAMSRAPAGCAWVTVMGNINAMAVSMLADCACVVLAEDVVLDADAFLKAQKQELTVLRSSQTIFETALAIQRLLEQLG